jgi:hypothetical protein
MLKVRGYSTVQRGWQVRSLDLRELEAQGLKNLQVRTIYAAGIEQV